MHLCPQYRDLQDNFGQSPLHLAALRGNEDVVYYLIDKCAGINTYIHTYTH
jgi:ankyrin repeat protein